MDLLDAKVKEFSEYFPPLTKRDDFDAFWEETISHTKNVPMNPTWVKTDYPTDNVTVYDISYNGFDETRINGWYIVPSFLKKDKYPCIIIYHGFNGSRETPTVFMNWVMMGMAVIAVDCREQGGITGNCAKYSTGMVTNVTSKGVLDKNEYYYRAVYMDCLKAIDFAEACREVDMDRIVIKGSSQGGALGMAICALDSRPKIGLFGVPSNSNIEKRIEGRHGSFTSVNDYLQKYPDKVDQVYETLSYFDIMNMADRIKCHVYAFVGLADQVCPAKYYFASYNRIKSEKQIALYPFNGHDGARAFHIEKEICYLKDSGILD